MVRRTDTGEFSHPRDAPADIPASVAGEVVLTVKERLHKLEGRPTVNVSLATGDEAIALVRWSRLHEQVRGFVPTGQVLASEKEQRGRRHPSMERPPADAVAGIAAQARHELPAEHDRCWIDRGFTSPSRSSGP